MRKMKESTSPMKKIRKPRKKMTPEQREAAAERLKLAREKRARENPPTYKNIDPDVLAKPDDHPFSRKNVMKWIKHQKEELSIARKKLKSGEKGAEELVANAAAYIRNLEKYLRDGDYIDNYMGPTGTQRVSWTCAVPAYNPDGTMKKTHGVIYPGETEPYDSTTKWSGSTPYSKGRKISRRKKKK